MIGALALKTLRAEVGSPVTAFSDIVIQDGTSFAVNESLRAIFPGGFTTNDPAAIELHAAFSGLQDDVLAVSLAPNKEAERQFLPTPSELKGRLLLADRGYPSIDSFKALDDAGASFVMRLSRGFDPECRCAPGTAKAQVAHLYRFRWQVELCFKERKSYANLKRFDIGNRHIVEGCDRN